MKRKKDRFKKKMSDPPEFGKKPVSGYGVITRVGNGTKYVMVKVFGQGIDRAKLDGFYTKKPGEGDPVKIIGKEFGVMVVELILHSQPQKRLN